jgi:predicted RNA-binding protein YlxR (DUF448 family)
MMKVKKIPLRKCLGCYEQFPKKDLVRVVRSQEGAVTLDLTGKAHGRGAYICHKKTCLDLALKKKAIQRALEVELSQAVIEALLEAIGDET